MSSGVLKAATGVEPMLRATGLVAHSNAPLAQRVFMLAAALAPFGGVLFDEGAPAIGAEGHER
eukprot:12654050-Alexandrium_andersonii.AAC.1